MKKIVSILLCALLCVSLLPAALAAGRETSREETLAGSLKELGLFIGTGNGFELDRRPNRAEALTMLIRALGLDAEAKKYPHTHPFTDVPEWADGYVSYAFDKGLTNGVSETLFDSDGDASCAMYLTFMLRALGYSDSDNGDFSWDSPWALASWCKILNPYVNRTDFLRADVVDVTCAALFAKHSDSEETLHERLAAAGVFTSERFNALFPANPFADYEKVDLAVSAAIAANEKHGQTAYNKYASICHVVLDVSEADGVLTCTTAAGTSDNIISSDNQLYSMSSNAKLVIIKLDASTLKCVAYIEPYKLSSDGSLPEEYTAAANAVGEMFGGIHGVLYLSAKRDLQNGTVKYRQPTYDEAMTEVTSSVSWITRTIETDNCTVILCGLGGIPHGSQSFLYLVYKKGSALGEGCTVSLPMPKDNAWGHSSDPNEFTASDDGLTLSYSYYYAEQMTMSPDIVIHEAGTYRYTTDLVTGTTELEIIADKNGAPKNS